MYAITRSSRPCARAARRAVLTAVLLLASAAAATASVPVAPVSPARGFTTIDPTPGTVRKPSTTAPMPIRPALPADLFDRLVDSARDGLERVLARGPVPPRQVRSGR